MTTPPAAGSYRLRPITPSDLVGLTRFYAGLSADSAMARFHGVASTIPDGTARFLCGPDHEHREGVVAESFDEGGEPLIIGHACIEPTDDDLAELAIAVADVWQHHGVGRALLAHAIAWAQVHGIDRLAASILSSNAAMFGLVRSMGLPVFYGACAEGEVDAYLDVRSYRLVAPVAPVAA